MFLSTTPTIVVLLYVLCALPALHAQSVDSLKQSLAKVKYPEQKAVILKKLAWAHRNINLKQSLDYSHDALDLAKRTYNRKLEAEVMRMIGVMYLHYVFHNEGLEWTQRALLLSQEIDYEEGVAFCYDSFGVTYYYQKKYVQAEEYFDNARKIFLKLRHAEGLGYVYTHLTWVYRETNRLIEAVAVGKKALEQRKIFGDIRLYANTLRDIAQIYDKQENFDAALAYIREAISIIEKQPNKPFIDEHYQSLAAIWYKKNADSSLYYAKIALKYANLRSDKRQKVIIYEEFAKIYKDKGDYLNALMYQTLHYQYQDSIYNDNIARNNASLEARFEYKQKEKVLIAEKKQQQAEYNLKIQQQSWIIWSILGIALFLGVLFFLAYRNYQDKRRLNRKLATQATALAENNAFKDKLFSIISHDLRAPLGQVQNVLEILEQGLLEQDEFEAILPTLRQNAVTTMDFLDNLLLWAKTQIQGQNIDKQYFQIQEVIAKNIQLFSAGASQKGIILKNNPEIQYQVFGDRHMIDLVLRNFINNAIKFCTKDDTIRVIATEKDAMLHICVADTGTGISPENIEKLLGDKGFSKQGTSGEKGSGLGLKLCKDFIEKNKGTIWIESEVGKGSRFYFSVPLKANF